RKESAHRLGQRLAFLGGRHVVRARREVPDASGFAAPRNVETVAQAIGESGLLDREVSEGGSRDSTDTLHRLQEERALGGERRGGIVVRPVAPRAPFRVGAG